MMGRATIPEKEHLLSPVQPARRDLVVACQMIFAIAMGV